MKKLPRGNNIVMPKKAPRRLPPKKEVDHEYDFEEEKKQLNLLREGIDRVNGLFVVFTRRQDSIFDERVIRRHRRIRRWGETVTSRHMPNKICVRMGSEGSRVVKRFAENTITF